MTNIVKSVIELITKHIYEIVLKMFGLLQFF